MTDSDDDRLTPAQCDAVLLHLGCSHDELGIVRLPPVTRPVAVRGALNATVQALTLADVADQIDAWRRAQPALRVVGRVA